MNEETLNMSMRKFLKMVGVSTQNEIEKAVERAIADGIITGNESFPAKATIEIAGIRMNLTLEGQLHLE